MKTAMARCLIESFTKPGELILDPFVGSGVVALESLTLNRGIICCDINPYAVVLTKAKLAPPPSLWDALARARHYLFLMESNLVSLDSVPNWVKQFFHPRTLQEILTLVELFRKNKEHFLLACLLGILHHQRPGFLSFPASHLVPYLRTRKFPQESYPELYTYRDVASRLENKIYRAYRHFRSVEPYLPRECIHCDAASLDLPPKSVDAIITSPPYMNALSYGRDNRLRLWFLGVDDYCRYDQMAPRNHEEFQSFMGDCLSTFHRILRPNGVCILVLGEVKRSNGIVNTGDLTIELATNEMVAYNCEEVVCDVIPDIHRARKEADNVKREWIIVLRRGSE